MATPDNTEQTSVYFDGYCAGGAWEPVPQRVRMGEAPADWPARAEEELDEALDVRSMTDVLEG